VEIWWHSSLVAVQAARLLISGDGRRNIYDRNLYVEDNRQLIVRIGKSEAEVTNNKRLRSTYCTVEAISAYRHDGSRGTAELLVLFRCRLFIYYVYYAMHYTTMWWGTTSAVECWRCQIIRYLWNGWTVVYGCLIWKYTVSQKTSQLWQAIVSSDMDLFW